MIRTRQPADLDGCVAALLAVHRSDAYPLNWPADPHRWLSPPRLLRAWVAESPLGLIAGHVALQDGGSVELSRLFVTPAARRGSLATTLMVRAVEWAAEHGRRLTLNVTDDGRSAAVAFYKATGWQYSHTTQADWTTPDGGAVYLRHYVLPTPDPAR